MLSIGIWEHLEWHGVAICKQPQSKEVPSITSYYHELYSILLMDLLSFGVRTHTKLYFPDLQKVLCVTSHRNQVFMHKEDSAEIRWPPAPRTCKAKRRQTKQKMPDIKTCLHSNARVAELSGQGLRWQWGPSSHGRRINLQNMQKVHSCFQYV